MGCSSSRPEKAEETGKPLPKLETVLHVDAASNGLPPPEHPPTSPAAGQTASSRAPPQAPAGSSYKGAVAPQNEAERLSVLKGLGVLEEVPDLHLDRICEALVQLFKVPVALVSLVDAERQFFKSAAGSVGAKLRCTSTDRNVSFCAWTLLPEHAQMLIVEDATQDARFSGNPLVVGDPFLRFYAGAPLVSSSGHRLGALCLHDYHARKLDADSCNMLCNFAEVAVRQIELAHVVKIGMDMNEATEAGVLRGPTQGTGVMLLDVSQDKWHILYRNELLDRLAGSAAFHHTFFDMLSLDGQTKAESWEMLRGGEDTWKQGQNFVLPAQLKTSKQTLQLEVDFRLAAQDALDEATEPIGIPSFVRAAEPDKYLHIWFATIYVLSAESKASRRPQAQVSPLKDVRLGPLITKTSCGRLYRATWKDKMAVVKVIGPRPAGHHGEAPGQAEAELSSKLKHPNIVETLMFNSFRADKGAKEGQDSTEDAAPLPREKSFIRSRSKDERPMWETWILREAWDKGSLEDRVAAGEFLLENASSAEALASMILRLATAAEQVAEALRYMHEQGIVHGGLTAEKIAACYTTQGQESVPVYKVCDLEQAHQGPKVSDMLHYGDVAHMAPELVSEGRLTEKCDIYAFGLLMWEMATGQHPWAGMSDAAIIEAVTENCQMPPLPVKAPSALKALIKACLAHEADDRPQPDAIVTALQHICKTAKTAALANGIASQPGFADFLNA